MGLLNEPVKLDVCQEIPDGEGFEPPLNVAVRVIGLKSQKVVPDVVMVIVGVASALTVVISLSTTAMLIIRTVASISETVFLFKVNSPFSLPL